MNLMQYIVGIIKGTEPVAEGSKIMIFAAFIILSLACFLYLGYKVLKENKQGSIKKQIGTSIAFIVLILIFSYFIVQFLWFLNYYSFTYLLAIRYIDNAFCGIILAIILPIFLNTIMQYLSKEDMNYVTLGIITIGIGATLLAVSMYGVREFVIGPIIAILSMSLISRIINAMVKLKGSKFLYVTSGAIVLLMLIANLAFFAVKMP